jgi:membrane protein
MREYTLKYGEQTTSFTLVNDIKIDITPYLETLREIINSATQIGTVGFVVLIFSATAMLRTFETAFNQIWGIKKARPFADKIIFFVFILLVGPLVFIIFFGFASKISDFVRAPHLYSISRDSEDNIWITGERGTLIKLDQKGNKIANINSLNIEKFLYTIEVASPQFILSIDNFNISQVDENNYQFSGSGRAFFINKSK